MKWFGREPALYLTGALTLLQLVAVLAHMSHNQQNALSVIATGAYTILLAVLTRPLDTSLITGAIATIATAVGAFGLHVSADYVSAFNAALVAVLAWALTNRVSPHPKIDPRRP